MGANRRAVYHLDVAIVRGCDGLHHTAPEPGFPPAHEAVVTGGAWAIALRQVSPRRTRSQHPEDAVQHTAVIDAWDASRLVGQQRFDHTPFEVGQIISAHAELESEIVRPRNRFLVRPECRYEVQRDYCPDHELK